MSKELTPKQFKRIEVTYGGDFKSEDLLKGMLDYPMLLTETKVLEKGSCRYEQLKELAKSFDVKVNVPTDFKKNME